MSVYRAGPPRVSLPLRAPWWRLLRAWLNGTLKRIEYRRLQQWIRRRRFTDEEIDRFLPTSLRRTVPLIGPAKRISR